MGVLIRTVIIIGVLLGGLGFVVSRPLLLTWLDAQDPWMAFALWYVLFFAFIQVASLLLFYRIDLGTFRGGLGILLLTFAWGIVAYLPASGYSLNIVHANPTGVPPFLLASEDELVYELYSRVLPGFPNYWMGILVYVLTPAALGVAAVFVIGPRRIGSAFARLIGLGNGGS